LKKDNTQSEEVIGDGGLIKYRICLNMNYKEIRRK